MLLWHQLFSAQSGLFNISIFKIGVTHAGNGSFSNGLDHIMTWWLVHFTLNFIYKIIKYVNNLFVFKLNFKNFELPIVIYKIM